MAGSFYPVPYTAWFRAVCVRVFMSMLHVNMCVWQVYEHTQAVRRCDDNKHEQAVQDGVCVHSSHLTVHHGLELEFS